MVVWKRMTQDASEDDFEVHGVCALGEKGDCCGFLPLNYVQFGSYAPSLSSLLTRRLWLTSPVQIFSPAAYTPVRNLEIGFLTVCTTL